MKLYYQKKDVTPNTEILKAVSIDNAGGMADSIELIFSDRFNLWSKWNPMKGDKIEVVEGSFKSGILYVDHLEQTRGKFIIKGLSTPLKAKTARSQSWENVRFLEIANEIARRYDFKLQAIDIINHYYEAVHQVDQTDFEFLSHRCLLEGYVLKISDNKVIIYDEAKIEQQKPSKTLYLEDFDGDFSFKTISHDLYSACVISSITQIGYIESTFKPIKVLDGPMLKKNLQVNNQSEADRFTRNLLRFENKKEHTGKVTKFIDTTMVAGSIVEISKLGRSDGRYLIYKAIHDFVEEKTTLLMRRPLEGY